MQCVSQIYALRMVIAQSKEQLNAESFSHLNRHRLLKGGLQINQAAVVQTYHLVKRLINLLHKESLIILQLQDRQILISSLHQILRYLLAVSYADLIIRHCLLLKLALAHLSTTLSFANR